MNDWLENNGFKSTFEKDGAIRRWHKEDSFNLFGGEPNDPQSCELNVYESISDHTYVATIWLAFTAFTSKVTPNPEEAVKTVLNKLKKLTDELNSLKARLEK